MALPVLRDAVLESARPSGAHPDGRHQLASLAATSQHMAAPADFGPVAGQILELLARDHGARRAALLLLEERGEGGRPGTPSNARWWSAGTGSFTPITSHLPSRRLLKTTERILGYKVRKYGIDPRRFRN